MASETVDPIDWSHPPPSWAVPWASRAKYKSVQLSHSRDSILQPCNLQHARQPPCLCGHSGYKGIKYVYLNALLLILNKRCIFCHSRYYKKYLHRVTPDSRRGTRNACIKWLQMQGAAREILASSDSRCKALHKKYLHRVTPDARRGVAKKINIARVPTVRGNGKKLLEIFVWQTETVSVNTTSVVWRFSEQRFKASPALQSFTAQIVSRQPVIL